MSWETTLVLGLRLIAISRQTMLVLADLRSIATSWETALMLDLKVDSHVLGDDPDIRSKINSHLSGDVALI